MRILLMGDFSGRANRGLLESGSALAERPVVPVDIDNFEDVLFRFAPRLRLPLAEAAGQGVTIGFRRLEDFHPDELYKRLEPFQALRRMRARLLDPASFEAAAAELRSGFDLPDTTPAEAAPAEERLVEDDEATLERLLGRRPADRPQARPGAGRAPDLTPFIKRIIAPHIAPSAPPHQDVYIAAVDEAIGGQMRALLHHPALQALEAAWRGVDRLTGGLETGEELKLYLLDVTKEELAADIQGAGGDMASCGLHRLLVEQGSETLGGEPWSLLAGDYSFGTGAGDLALLAALGALGSRAGGPFVAAAHPGILGCRSLHETPDPADWKGTDAGAGKGWRALRGSPMAPWIGLALPRLLLRLPYGAKTDSVEGFEFEEFPAEPGHEAYLWGSPAFACALLIGRAFQERGWSMEPGDCLDIDDLPAHIRTGEDGPVMQPCAEVCLGERAMQAILGRGLMPFLSHRNRNAVRLARFQSIAEPPTALAGPWG